jgi:serine/threonine protein kinase
VTERPTLAGTDIADFRLERLLGRGGMGEVYLAEDQVLGRRVALKLLAGHLVDDTTARTRFQREIETAARIEHVSIVPVYQAGFDPASRRFFIAMRFVDGPDLAAHLTRDGPLAPERAVRLLGQVGAGLYAVHRAGMVHRDIKPQNVLLWAPGEPDEHALLTDFGIAKAVDESLGITRGAVIGTLPYIAPEVWAGQPATAATDQYALACLAFEILAGYGPYDGADGEWRARHLDHTPAALPRQIAPSIRDCVTRALAKDQRARFPSVPEFVAALGGQPALARSDAVTQLLAATQPKDAIRTLTTQFGLAEDTAAQLSGVDPSQVIRMRRLAARRAVVGEEPPT